MQFLNKLAYNKLTESEQNEILMAIKNAYLNKNLTIKETSNKLQINKSLIDYLLKINNIKKSKELLQQSKERTMLSHYGVINNFQLDSVKNKIKETCENRYSTTNGGASSQALEKARQTKLKKYNNENYVNIDKRKQTNLKKYGVECVFSNKTIQDKIKNTTLKNHGVKSVLEKAEIRQLSHQGIKDKYNVSNFSYVHLTPNQTELITDKSKFYDYIMKFKFDERTPKNIASSIGLSRTGIYGVIRRFNFSDLFNFCSSYYEKEINDYIRSLNVNTECHNRTLIKPLEIDIYIPEFNFGIEFNGNYWHSDENKNKKYHQEKSLAARDKNTFIYHIFEYEWNDKCKQNIIKSQLRNLCHKNENKIYARNCEIKEVTDNKLIKKFLNDNHLQGYRPSKIKLGLFYNNELVSLITLGKPYLSKSNKYDYEIHRFCNKLNTSVIGSFNKLFKHFITVYQPTNILTYSDFTKGTGSIYDKSGFMRLELTDPNYIWTNDNEIKTRYQTQMKNEKEIMSSNGYIRIYDCGNYKWFYENK